jgi:hypothetical protein
LRHRVAYLVGQQQPTSQGRCEDRQDQADDTAAVLVVRDPSGLPSGVAPKAQRALHRVGVLLPQARRTLHIGEHERHRARRQIGQTSHPPFQRPNPPPAAPPNGRVPAPHDRGTKSDRMLPADTPGRVIVREPPLDLAGLRRRLRALQSHDDQASGHRPQSNTANSNSYAQGRTPMCSLSLTITVIPARPARWRYPGRAKSTATHACKPVTTSPVARPIGRDDFAPGRSDLTSSDRLRSAAASASCAVW